MLDGILSDDVDDDADDVLDEAPLRCAGCSVTRRPERYTPRQRETQ
jgi:hypothetical protein